MTDCGRARPCAPHLKEPRDMGMSPSPFPPIADFAFLSNCHTRALVAPDGAIGWPCVPSFDSPTVLPTLPLRGAERLRAAARPGGGLLPPRPVRAEGPHGPPVRARDEHPRDDVVRPRR